jgi:hypothetical protein
LRKKCLLKHVTEGNIRKNRRDGETRKKSKLLLDDFKEMTSDWKMKKETLDRSLWKTCFERGYGPVVRWTK